MDDVTNNDGPRANDADTRAAWHCKLGRASPRDLRRMRVMRDQVALLKRRA